MEKVYYLEDVMNEQDYSYFEIISQLQKKNQHDALAFIFYIAMLECGYTSQESDSLPTYNNTVVAEHIKNFQSSVFLKKDKVYNIVMYVNRIRCNLDLLVFSKSLIANISIPLCDILKSKSYQCLENIRNYEELRSVCLDFKNNLAVPAKILCLSEHSIYYASLEGMPYDILVYLTKYYLNFEDFVSLIKTCKCLNGLVDEESVWFQFCRRKNVELAKNKSPKILFREYWCSRKEKTPSYLFDIY